MQVPSDPYTTGVVFHFHTLVDQVDVGDVERAQAAVIRGEFIEDRFESQSQFRPFAVHKCLERIVIQVGRAHMAVHRHDAGG